MIEPRALVAYCDRFLDASSFSDYAPNGLQVEGERPIRRLVSGVTASAALIESAIVEEADAILVHHGWFWKGESPCLVGMKGQRARMILRAGMSLIAYHLPLDAHPEVGNNALLARRLGFIGAEPSALGHGLLWVARLQEPVAPDDFAALVAKALGRAPLLVGCMPRRIGRVAWCTGGGQGHIEQAAELGVDAFLSGEISEQTTHQARELGLCFVAAGHHATERYGVQALGEHLSENFGLRHRFVDIENPA
ncbi:Nif3-like dinuclear metal center hexameric protein [Thiorhodococcus mannitoliphagus]|uniref:GTP cyclohydrolase 1 type 2 homolog n=1 Tax=Thiorhodococcus mannitoliphagus TaxID=329406 RepID=A0A6P1DVP5_9GAMM|nr:Nif3-like dinuclear metal center hexameric protein [Thiorhodococcus mannitoliphagus]NEX21560.1 Nif3-like dinuclear metal center hexameric protein [Thiorhodococcus mannitoliphagus]